MPKQQRHTRDPRRRPSSRPTSQTTCRGPDRQARDIARPRTRSRRENPSFSPGPASNVPALRPTPRKLNAQRRDADARHAPWPPDTPPWCASCRRAADADGRIPPPRAARPSGTSSSASSGPAGPGISRRKSGRHSQTFRSAPANASGRVDKSDVAGPLQHDVLGRSADRPGIAASPRPGRRDRARVRR